MGKRYALCAPGRWYSLGLNRLQGIGSAGCEAGGGVGCGEDRLID